MRVKFGSGNEELDLVQCAALRDITAEVRRLRAENESLLHDLADEKAYSSGLREQAANGGLR
jgi:hypothetical protein